jgi:RNA polymerase sigma-70 factor, ECF subfamily
VDTDAEIFQRSIRDPDAFREIFERHASTVHTYARKRIGTTAGEEILAQTFLTAFEKRARFDLSYESARPWLLGIATNIIRHHLREEREHLTALGKMFRERSEAPVDDVARLDAQRMKPRLIAALLALSDDDRETFLLLALGQLTYEEVASAPDPDRHGAFADPSRTDTSSRTRSRPNGNSRGRRRIRPGKASRELMDESEQVERTLAGFDDDPVAVGRARSRLLDAIASEKRRRHRRRRLFLPAAASIALGVAVALVLALVGPLGGSTAAAAELRHLAGIASSAQAPRLADGEYLLVVSDELRPESTNDLVTGVSFTVDSRLHVQTWIAGDGSSFRRTEWISSEFASDADRRSWEEAGKPNVPHAGDVKEERFRSGEGLLVDLSGVSREPAELLAALRAGVDRATIARR